MRTPRKIARGCVLIALTVALYPLLVAAMILLLPAPQARLRSRNAIFHLWSRLCLRVLGGRLIVDGRPPTAPFFLVSNHLSYIDILVLASVVDTFFIAKAEIRSWPLFGLLCRTVGTIFIDRELRRDVQRVNRLVADTLQEGYGVVLFPEGTSSQGHEVMAFRSALLAYPAQQGMAVHCSTLCYRTPPGEIPANLSICWWGDAPFGPHFLQLLGVARFEARVRFIEAVVTGEDRKELARTLRERISEHFEPVVAIEDRSLETGF